jgi:hypothetical protein
VGRAATRDRVISMLAAHRAERRRVVRVHEDDLGFGPIVVSEIGAPNLLANLV